MLVSIERRTNVGQLGHEIVGPGEQMLVSTYRVPFVIAPSVRLHKTPETHILCVEDLFRIQEVNKSIRETSKDL